MSVTCVKCRGRISPENIEHSYRLQRKARPGVEPKPPKVCIECVWMSLLALGDEDAKGEEKT